MKPRRVAIIALWTLALFASIVAIGLRVRAHRLADPAQALRPYLSWLPDDLAAHAAIVDSRTDRDGLTLQVELVGSPTEIRNFAKLNRMESVEGSPAEAGSSERWQLVDNQRPGRIVHLLLPGNASPALLTVVDTPGGAPSDRLPQPLPGR